MPHITVDYSAALDRVLDRKAFARDLHPVVVSGAGSAGTCKTFFRAAEETYLGDSDAPAAFVHVDIGLLPGRSNQLKERLADEVLELLAKHLHPQPDDRVIRSVEVRDLPSSYRLHPLQH
ncbi:5-carboxymethyl-2-hydroxymuconate Delta-isomerase [Embleya sp. AB8]|uniref:5-carboxymethyl-2-hydroxymuconate Delta-isomerase n=1 Tax=Embleya sp. AB8 TaxID=3156304 RepID=UPI003C736F0D